jgi:hypothetical protein
MASFERLGCSTLLHKSPHPEEPQSISGLTGMDCGVSKGEGVTQEWKSIRRALVFRDGRYAASSR